MSVIPFSGELKCTNTMNRMKNRYMSTLKINAEWRLVCLWSQYAPYKPAFLEIHRESPAKEILVSGNLTLMHNRQVILKRKFSQLIETGFESTLLELEYIAYGYDSDDDDDDYDRNYSIVGSLKISDYEEQTEDVKGVQFKSLLDLSKDLECLLDPKSTYFSDVNVNCGTVSFSAHKNILSARSPVFAAMFSSQMKENRNNKVDISDLSPQVLKTMLGYIYSGKTGQLSVQSAGELLFAADKYQLQDLKRVCSEYLKSCVAVENVLSTLVLGDLHDNDLKVFAMDFICSSCEEFEVLEKTAEWKTLREKRPALTMDVLTRLIKSRDQKLKRSK